MKEYRIPFDYSCSTQLKKKAAQGRRYCATSEKYYDWLIRQGDVDGTTYLLSGEQVRAYREARPGDGAVCDYGAYEDKYKGQTAFVLCPGPTVAAVTREVAAGKLTYGVNTIGWRVAPRYWVAAEWEWGHWLYHMNHDRVREIREQLDHQDWWLTPRAAVWVWKRRKDYPKLPLYRRTIVSRLEEEHAVPFPVDGTTAFNAIAAAWWMGCSRCVVFGMDLDKQAGAYVPGVPVSAKGALNPFSAQIKAMQQCKYPGMTIYNASPVSQKFGLPFEPVATEEALRWLAESPEVPND